MLRFAIPSKGAGYDGATALLQRCGLSIARATPRQYTARLKGVPDTELLLHRPGDIVEKVASGDIDLGVTGLDLVHEQSDDDSLIIVYDDLGFWRVELAFAAPQTWIDVSSWHDLADLAVEFQSQGRLLRIATKFPNTVRRCCYSNGINAFQLVRSEGATEAAPNLGYADIIADIVETGSALRDNQLKIVGGPILRSQACLIASRRSLQSRPVDRLAIVRHILELIEAQQRGRSFHSLIANVPGESVDTVGRQLAARPELAGLQGPTIAPVWNKHALDTDDVRTWFAVNVVVLQGDLLAAVDHLRSIGASTVTVTSVQYAFQSQSVVYTRLLEQLASAS